MDMMHTIVGYGVEHLPPPPIDTIDHTLPTNVITMPSTCLTFQPLAMRGSYLPVVHSIIFPASTSSSTTRFRFFFFISIFWFASSFIIRGRGPEDRGQKRRDT